MDCNGADLTGANALASEMRDSCFQNTVLRGACFDGAVLNCSDFAGSDMRRTFLNNTHMQGARFKGANLSMAYLTASHAENADFTDAILAGTNFYGCGLHGASMENAAFSGNGFRYVGARPEIMPLESAVLLAPTAELAADTPANAVIKEGGYMAPYNEQAKPLDKGLILVSGIDLNTVGSIMALRGIKPEDTGFWKAAESISMRGLHHIHELPQEVQDKLNAYYAYEHAARGAEGPLPEDRISNVTKAVQDRTQAVGIILNERHPEHAQYIRNGMKWEKEMTETVEAQHVFDTENVRVFITEGPSTAASFYSPETGDIMPATATLDMKTKAITIAFEDGGKDGKSAREIVQKLWDPEADGKDGIAISPEGEVMYPEDLVKAVMHVEEAVQPTLSMERFKDLNNMSDALRKAVGDNISERGLDISWSWNMDASINR